MAKHRSKRAGSGAVSYTQIVDTLRQEIIDGKLASGDRLPTCDDLQRRFGAARMTVHRACRHLASLGYAQSRAKVGTYVADFPPHLYRYGMVFPHRVNGDGWSSFWATLELAAQSIAAAERPKEFLSFYDVNGHSDVEDYQRLISDIEARRLAGIILLSAPHFIEHTPVFTGPSVPRVYIGADVWWRYHVPSVAPDTRSFVGRAVEYAARRGRHRPVMISTNLIAKNNWQPWAEACELYEMEAPERWHLVSSPVEPPEASRHITQILMQLPKDRRPDVLVVGDDHLVPEVTAGLLASNLPEKEMPLVIAHANFPYVPRALLPVTYLGFDSNQIIRACMDVLDAQRRGQQPSSRTLVPAVFAEEHAAASGVTQSVAAPQLLEIRNKLN